MRTKLSKKYKNNFKKMIFKQTYLAEKEIRKLLKKIPYDTVFYCDRDCVHIDVWVYPEDDIWDDIETKSAKDTEKIIRIVKTIRDNVEIKGLSKYKKIIQLIFKIHEDTKNIKPDWSVNTEYPQIKQPYDANKLEGKNLKKYLNIIGCWWPLYSTNIYEHDIRLHDKIQSIGYSSRRERIAFEKWTNKTIYRNMVVSGVITKNTRGGCLITEYRILNNEVNYIIRNKRNSKYIIVAYKDYINRYLELRTNYNVL